MYFVEIKGEKAFLTSEELNGGSACNRKISRLALFMGSLWFDGFVSYI